MGETALVVSYIAAAKALVQQLETDGITPSHVLWYFFENTDDWKLLLAGKYFDSLLPKQEASAYLAVVKAHIKLSDVELPLSAIQLVKTDDPIVKAAELLMKTGDALTVARFGNTLINGIFIKEMFIMRSNG
jgi:hypothetical protein